MEKKSPDVLKNWFRKWGLVDLSVYRGELNRPVLFVCLTFEVIIYLFHIPLISLLNWMLVAPLLSAVPNTVLTDIILLLTLASSAIFLLRKLTKHLLPSVNSVMAGAAGLLGYFILSHFKSGYELTHFSLSFLNRFTYGTCIMLTVLPFLLTYKTYFRALAIKTGRLSFIEDAPNIDKYIDIYNRQEFADTLFNHIMATTTSSAFVIGVIGDWGSGKTDLNERLKKKLAGSTDNIILDFNAWRLNKADVMIESFFKALSVKLRPYNYSIAGKIREYSKKILQPGKEFPYRIFDTLIGEFFPQEDIQAQYDSINQAISGTGKRLVIFIDDTDRLSSKEVMEVLRLVRNTADFANTFFIVGIDHAYIVSALTHSKEYANEAEYLKKIFQFIITLPSVKKAIFLREAKSLLETPDLENAEKQRIEGGLSKLSYDRKDLSVQLYEGANLDGLLEGLLENMRDVKRFVNSFKVCFNLLKDEADIHDLIVLELIRNKSVEVYNRIRSKELIEYSMEKIAYVFSQKKWANFEDQEGKHLSPKDLAVLKTSVEYLFANPGNKNTRRLLDAPNFYIYFSYQLFNQISIKVFNDLWKKGTDDIVAEFDTWIEEKKEADLIKITGELEVFPNADFLHKVISVFLRINSTNSAWAIYTRHLFYEKRAFNLVQYFNKDMDMYKQFIWIVMTDGAISLLSRAKLAYLFLYEMVKGSNTNMIYSKREWQRIVYSLFDQFLAAMPNDMDVIMEFYQLNDYQREDHWIILYPPAGRRLRAYLLANQAAFEQFTQIMIGQSPSSDRGFFDIHVRVISAIFSIPMYYKSLLKTKMFTDKAAENVKKIVLAHYDEYLANNKPFFLAESERPE